PGRLVLRGEVQPRAGLGGVPELALVPRLPGVLLPRRWGGHDRTPSTPPGAALRDSGASPPWPAAARFDPLRVASSTTRCWMSALDSKAYSMAANAFTTLRWTCRTYAFTIAWSPGVRSGPSPAVNDVAGSSG